MRGERRKPRLAGLLRAHQAERQRLGQPAQAGVAGQHLIERGRLLQLAGGGRDLIGGQEQHGLAGEERRLGR